MGEERCGVWRRWGLGEGGEMGKVGNGEGEEYGRWEEE